MIDIPDTKARMASAGPAWLRVRLREALAEIEALRYDKDQAKKRGRNETDK